MKKYERILNNWAPVKLVRTQSQAAKLPGFHGHSLYAVVMLYLRRIDEMHLPDRAAAISFNFLLAVPAATIFLLSIFPYFPISNALFMELVNLVQSFTPNAESRALVISFLSNYFKPDDKAGVLSLGFLVTIFYASNAMMVIIRTFDHSLGQYKYKSNFLEKRWRAIKLITVMILLLIGTILISLGQGYFFKKLMDWLNLESAGWKVMIQVLRWLIAGFMFIYALGFIYKYAPSVKKRWSLYSPGAVLATILLILVTAIFGYWAQNVSNFDKVYGSIASILVIMMGVWLNSLVLLIGFELNVCIALLGYEKVLAKQAPHLLRTEAPAAEDELKPPPVANANAVAGTGRTNTGGNRLRSQH